MLPKIQSLIAAALFFLWVLLPATPGWSSPTLTETQVYSSPAPAKHSNLVITLAGIVLAYELADRNFGSFINDEPLKEILHKDTEDRRQVLEQVQPQSISENTSSEHQKGIRFVPLFGKNKSGKNPYNPDSDDEIERSAWQAWQAINNQAVEDGKGFKLTPYFESNNENGIKEPDIAEISINTPGGKPDTSTAYYGDFFEGKTIACPVSKGSQPPAGKDGQKEEGKAVSENPEYSEFEASDQVTLLAEHHFGGPVRDIEFSRTSQLLTITSYQADTVIVHDLEQKKYFTIKSGRAANAAISIDSSQVLIGNSDLLLSREKSWKCEHIFKMTLGHPNFNADGSLMVATTMSEHPYPPDPAARVFHKENNLWRLTGQIPGKTYSAEFSPDGSRLLTRPDTSELRYEIHFSQKEDGSSWLQERIDGDYDAHQFSATFSQTGQILAIATSKGVRIQEYDDTTRPKRWRQIKKDDEQKRARSGKFSPDSSRLIAVFEDGFITIYRHDEPNVWIAEFNFQGMSASFSPDGLRVVSYSAEDETSMATIYRLSDKGVWEIEHTIAGKLAVFSPNSSLIALVHEGRVNIYGLVDGMHWLQKAHILLPSSTRALLPVFSPDSSVLGIRTLAAVDHKRYFSEYQCPGGATIWKLNFND